MARASSTRSGSKKSKGRDAETVAPEADGEMGGDTVLVGEDTLGEDAVAVEPDPDTSVTLEPGDTLAAETVEGDSARTEIVEAEPSTDEAAPEPDTAEAEPTPAATTAAPEPAVEKRGAGVGSMLIGGVVAAALGYGAAILGSDGSGDNSASDTALADAIAAIEAQQGTIDALQAQLGALAAVEPPVIPDVDLSGVEGAIDAVANDVAGLSTGIEAMTARIVALEERPIFSGEVAEDSAAMAAALDALETRLGEERAAAAEAVAAAEAAQAAAAAEMQATAAAAQAAIAEAEARAQDTAAATQTQAALSRVQIAMAAGGPFADALSSLPGDVPQALAAAAETGVPTLADLQATFPAAARAALPIALREVAGDSTTSRFGAFLMGQIGGRSIEPREGSDPDAVLSRAGAAVSAGDLPAALTEIAALPDGAQAMMQDWVAQVEARVSADAALADLAAALDN